MGVVRRDFVVFSSPLLVYVLSSNVLVTHQHLSFSSLLKVPSTCCELSSVPAHNIHDKREGYMRRGRALHTHTRAVNYASASISTNWVLFIFICMIFFFDLRVGNCSTSRACKSDSKVKRIGKEKRKKRGEKTPRVAQRYCTPTHRHTRTLTLAAPGCGESIFSNPRSFLVHQKK